MPRKTFTTTAYTNLSDFIYGSSIHPIPLKNGMTIGGGTIYPEINFTLPTMAITKETMPEVVAIYKDIITGICDRARELYVPGFVAEIEMLPPMTENPSWGTEVTKVVADVIKEHSAKHNIKGALRVTPADIREGSNLEHMWRGRQFEAIMGSFEGSAKAGADFLSIESVGGKEVHDEAVMYCDIAKSIFALSVLGCKDMEKLWTSIVEIGDKTGAIPAGDTACGFANTAMVMAEKNYIPRVFSAVVRVISVVRSLVPVECGAKGPHKDCGYEGVYIKAISGTPIAMEGYIAACAHLSPVGNIATCVADMWSNESVQHIRLLGGMAPTVSFEQLSYHCRLLNEAKAKGHATIMRDLYADSDSRLDPQAYVLRPDVVLDISKEIVKESGSYNRAKKAAGLAASHIIEANKSGLLNLSEKELTWAENIGEAVGDLPADVGEFTEQMINECEKYDSKKYEI